MDHGTWKCLSGRDSTCYANDTRNGHLEVFKWARARAYECPWEGGTRTASTFAGGGHLEVLKWARSTNGCPLAIIMDKATEGLCVIGR